MLDFFRRDEVRAAIRRRLVLLSVLAALPTYLALGARSWWFLELATHFRVHYLLGLCPAVIAAWYWRRPILLAWVGVAVVINLWLVVPLYFGPHVTGAKPTLRLMVANVLTQNQQYDRLLNLIDAENPDVVVLLEVNLAWRQGLQALGSEFPHKIFETREDNFGICLLSKIPADRLEVTEIGTSGVPSIEATFQHQGQTLQLIATHTLPPGSRANASERNAHLQAAAEKLAQLPSPKLFVGDLNITPWSPYFDDLLEVGQLENSQRGFGVQGTWFSQLPIDHVLHSNDVLVVDRRVGARFGSDHRPLIVDLEIK